MISGFDPSEVNKYYDASDRFSVPGAKNALSRRCTSVAFYFGQPGVQIRSKKNARDLYIGNRKMKFIVIKNYF